VQSGGVAALARAGAPLRLPCAWSGLVVADLSQTKQKQIAQKMSEDMA